MNPTKSIVTGAVALAAFASVLGVSYAQVENSTDQSATQQQQQQQPVDQYAAPAEQSMTQDQSTPAADPNMQAQPEAQSQQSQDQLNQNSSTMSQEPLPTDATSAGTPETPAPRADRN